MPDHHVGVPCPRRVPAQAGPLSTRCRRSLTSQPQRRSLPRGRHQEADEICETTGLDCLDGLSVNDAECHVCTCARDDNVRDSKHLRDRPISQCQRELRASPDPIEHGSARRFGAMPRRDVQLQPAPSRNMQLSWRRCPMALVAGSAGLSRTGQ